jgi:hypothetical protein
MSDLTKVKPEGTLWHIDRIDWHMIAYERSVELVAVVGIVNRQRPQCNILLVSMH